MINVLEHKEFVEAIFNKYSLPISCYEIVDDIKKWCKENDKPESNPFRPALCLCSTEDGTFRIVFRKEQTDAIISSVKEAMQTNGFYNEVQDLNSDIKYLEHLILHEISCKILGTTEQEPRDRWAFKEMGI